MFEKIYASYVLTKPLSKDGINVHTTEYEKIFLRNKKKIENVMLDRNSSIFRSVDLPQMWQLRICDLRTIFIFCDLQKILDHLALEDRWCAPASRNLNKPCKLFCSFAAKYIRVW
jgi:hypothetical protein